MGIFDGYMIASDFDRTLNRDGISERNVKAIRRFRAEGGRFGVITGRCYSAVFPYISDSVEGYCDFYLCVNGGQGFLADRTPIFETRSDISLAAELYECIRNFGGAHYIGCAIDKDLYALGEPGEEGKTWVGDLADRGYFHQINVAFPSLDLARELRDLVREKFPGRLNPLQNGGTVDIPVGDVSKETGARAAAEYFGVPEENIFTVGDNYNDMDMIEAFNGCAVENAVDDLKAAAKCVVPDVAGVVEYIEKTRAL